MRNTRNIHMEGKASGRTVAPTTRPNSELVVAMLVALTTVIAGIGAGVVSAQTGSPTPIDSCGTIDEPGEYVLTTNVTNTSADPCIAITASDVVFDGGGHTLAGNRSNYGVRVDNGDVPQSNVTVRNVAADNWVRAISFVNATGGVVENSTATGSIEGYLVQESTNVVVRHNYAYDNALGIHVRNAERNLVTRNVANENKWGIHLEYRARQNRIVENVARNNSNQDLMARQDSTANVVTRLDVGSGTFSFVTTNVAMRGTDSTPSEPEGRVGINSSIVATAATSEDLAPVLDSLTVHYRNASGEVSSLALWRYDGGSWSDLDSTSRPAENAISTGNLTEFGTFVAFGSGDVSAERVTLDVTPPTLTERSAEATMATGPNTTTRSNATTAPGTMTSVTPTATTETSAPIETTMTETATAAETTETATPAPDTTAVSTTSTASVEATGTEAGVDAATETTGPGFGFVVALLAVLGAALLATRRKR